jgi:hypothetical protein
MQFEKKLRMEAVDPVGDLFRCGRSTGGSTLPCEVAGLPHRPKLPFLQNFHIHFQVELEPQFLGQRRFTAQRITFAPRSLAIDPERISDLPGFCGRLVSLPCFVYRNDFTLSWSASVSAPLSAVRDVLPRSRCRTRRFQRRLKAVFSILDLRRGRKFCTFQRRAAKLSL